MKTSYSNFINENKGNNVRLRFSPSPTGPLHCGGVRTALYNYLFAKQNNGKMILRIEDTDSSRFVPGAEKYIQDSFDWLGIEFDESPSKGGNYGPYRQSERKDIYKKYVDYLIDNDFAYYAFDTKDEIDSKRKEIENFAYDSSTRNQMKNSLTLPKEEVDNLLSNRNDWVVRIKYPDNPVDIVVDDMIRGKITMNTSTLDDKVIWKKNDELPTYHLANVVDDHLMKISHVIRAEEWIPSSPLHVYLYNCFNWDKPKFGHLPLVLGPNGGKLSKRDGDKYGFPVFPLKWTNPESGEISRGYKQDGYLPEAVINILAFLGWNPGTNKELYTMDELINDFSFSRVNKSGAKFNQVKAAWFNGQYIKDIPTELLIDDFKKELKKRNIKMDDSTIFRIIEDNKGKINFVNDLFDVVNYLFEKPKSFDKKATKKWKDNSPDIINGFIDKLKEIDNWVENDIQKVFETYVKDNGIKFGEIAPLLRVLITGLSNGPSLFNIMELIGKDETIDRLSNFDIFNDIKIKNTENNQEDQKLSQYRNELDTVKKLITSSKKKLDNKNFIEKAPEQVVSNEKQKLIDYQERKEELESLIDELSK